MKFTGDGRRSGWADDHPTRCALAEGNVEGIVGQGDIRRLIELVGQHRSIQRGCLAESVVILGSDPEHVAQALPKPHHLE